MNEPDLQTLVEHLRRQLGERLDAVVLFGSRARGEATEESDWDLLIIVEGLPRSPLARKRLWLSVAPPEWVVWAAPLLHTPEEWYGHISSLTLDIALDGLVLYDAHGHMKSFLDKVRFALQKTGLRRIRKGRDMLWLPERPGQRPWYKVLQEAMT